MAVWQVRSAWRSGLPGGGPVPAMSASAGMRPSAVTWQVRLCGMRSMIWWARSLRRPS